MSFLRQALKIILILLTVVLLAGSAVIWYLNREIPDVDSLRNVQMQVPLRVYSSDGLLIAEFGEMRRQPVPLSQIPLPIQQAVIATEDQRFYEHSGVDFLGLVRAAIEVWRHGDKVQGGSTITMQVARNFFLDPQKTYTRKVKEILLALKIGRELPKDKVLELYLNKVYFGKRAYGVAAAAQVYYGKTLDQLTLPEMAMLAGLPQAPSSLNPINNPSAALERRNHVLARMHEQGYINQTQYQEAVAAPLTGGIRHSAATLSAPYVAEAVRDAMVKEYGDAAYTMGLNVYTTINSNDQKIANRALENGLLLYDVRHGYRGPLDNWGKPTVANTAELLAKLRAIPTIADIHPALVLSVFDQSIKILLSNGKEATIAWDGLSWARKSYQQGRWVGPEPSKASDIVKIGDVISVRQTAVGVWSMTQLPQAEAALVSLNPQDGAMLSMVGGFNFERSKFNRILTAKRQPGSGFKPFIYSTALANGYTLASLVNDAPIVQEDQTTNDLWRPHNDNLVFNGPTRLRVGLMQSRNLVTIRLVQQLGLPTTIRYIKRFGFDDTALPSGLSLALGSGVVTPLELARGLATFANGGFLITPYFINKVVNDKGEVLFQANPDVACANCALDMTALDGHAIAPRVIDPQNAYLINSAMKSVITSGTGKAARVLKRADLAGKTGTTNDETDAWFTGFNTQVLTVTWLGFDQPQSTFEYGSAAALPIWIEYMQQVLQNQPLADLPRPAGIVSIRINNKSGLPTTADDPDSLFELFRAQDAASLAKAVNNPSSQGFQPIF